MALAQAHAMNGATILGLLPYALGAPAEVTVPLVVIGAYTGACADTDGFFCGFSFVEKKLRFKYNYEIYERHHRYTVPVAKDAPLYSAYYRILRWFPSYAVGHLFADKPFHKKLGVSWFPEMLWLELLYDIVNPLLWLTVYFLRSSL